MSERYEEYYKVGRRFIDQLEASGVEFYPMEANVDFDSGLVRFPEGTVLEGKLYTLPDGTVWRRQGRWLNPVRRG